MKETPHLVGIDVSARSLEVAVDDGHQEQQSLNFPNTESGHRCLVRRLTKSAHSARVVLEASGIYSLDLDLALHRAPRIEVMVTKPARFSRVGNRYLRFALYMPALVSSLHEPHIKAFYGELIARGKKPKEALVAVMRKLLHSIHGMLRTGTDFDGEKFRALAEGP